MTTPTTPWQSLLDRLANRQARIGGSTPSLDRVKNLVAEVHGYGPDHSLDYSLGLALDDAINLCAALEGHALAHPDSLADRQLADRAVNLALDIARRANELEGAR